MELRHGAMNDRPHEGATREKVVKQARQLRPYCYEQKYWEGDIEPIVRYHAIMDMVNDGLIRPAMEEVALLDTVLFGGRYSNGVYGHDG